MQGFRLIFETNGFKALYFQGVETKRFQHTGSSCCQLAPPYRDAELCLLRRRCTRRRRRRRAAAAAVAARATEPLLAATKET